MRRIEGFAARSSRAAQIGRWQNSLLIYFVRYIWDCFLPEHIIAERPTSLTTWLRCLSACTNSIARSLATGFLQRSQIGSKPADPP